MQSFLCQVRKSLMKIFGLIGLSLHTVGIFLSCFFSVVSFRNVFSRFGAFVSLTVKKLSVKLYFLSSSLLGRGAFTRQLLSVQLSIFYPSFKKLFRLNRNFSVTRKFSAYMIWRQKSRAYQMGLVFFPLRWTVPARLLVQEPFHPIKRRESEKFVLPAVLYLPFILLYVVYGQRPYDLPVVGAYFPTPVITPTSLSSVSVENSLMFTSTPAPTFTPAYVLPAGFGQQMYGFTSTPESNFPFDFPVILDKGSFYSRLNMVLFSYYYPDLGGVNCHEDNWVNGKCKNITASKVVGWREYMGKGLAVHPDMLSSLPYGSMVYVTHPSSLKGFYTVVDLCGGCYINSSYYFDFLFSGMPSGITWSDPVHYGVVRLGWDGDFPTPAPTLAYLPTALPASPEPSATPTALPASPDPSVTPTVLPASPEPSATPTVLPASSEPSATPEPSVTVIP